MQIGFIGLGKMGSRMVKKLVSEGHQVVAWNRSKEVVDTVVSTLSNDALQHFSPAATVKDLLAALPSPKVVWLMLPAGDVTEQIFQELLTSLTPGDIVIDGGNAFYKDTQRRFETCEKKSIRFLGVGVSGGVLALKNGYPLMVGGDKTAYEYLTPIFESLAKPNGGYAYLGTGGAGHFVKMVHNGIEYGMMQAIGEGFGILDTSDYGIALLKAAHIWQKGTIVSGLLMDCAYEALEKDPHLSHIVGSIPENGEARWTIEAAQRAHIPARVIEEALHFRLESQNDEKLQQTFAARMVAALRNIFGGHPLTLRK